jgi:hypothetical protein
MTDEQIKRLEQKNSDLMAKCIRAKAIKEFAEKLNKKLFPLGMTSDGNYSINAKAVKAAIDNLVKEMVGDNE